MKKNWFKLAGVTALALAIGLGLAGCFLLAPETPNYPREMWGEWVGHNTYYGQCYQFYITSTAVYETSIDSSYVRDREITSGVSISPAGSNGLILTRNGKNEEPWRIYPLRTSTARFSGSIANLTSEERSVNRVIGGKGWMDLVVKNLNDAAQTKTATTDAAGHFTIDGIIPGDTYGVTAEGKTVEVKPNADGDDIGTITLADGLNFKASIEPASNVMLAGGKNYSCSIYIKNTGTGTATACNYRITGEDGELYSGVVGSVAPGKTKEIYFSARCGAISTEKRFKRYNVVITDPINNRTWNDSVSLLFYKGTITLTIMSDVVPSAYVYLHNSVKGVIISPEKISYPFNTVSKVTNKSASTISLPRLRGNYLIAVGYASQETIYAIDMSIFSAHLNENDFLSQAKNFAETGNYEPNDTEETAQIIDRPIISYFHNGDIDYYLVKVD